MQHAVSSSPIWKSLKYLLYVSSVQMIVIQYMKAMQGTQYNGVGF